MTASTCFGSTSQSAGVCASWMASALLMPHWCSLWEMTLSQHHSLKLHLQRWMRKQEVCAVPSQSASRRTRALSSRSSALAATAWQVAYRRTLVTRQPKHQHVGDMPAHLTMFSLLTQTRTAPCCFRYDAYICILSAHSLDICSKQTSLFVQPVPTVSNVANIINVYSLETFLNALIL